MAAAWRVALEISSSALSECRQYSDVPVLDPAHIAVVAAPGEDSEALALYQELRRLVGALHPAAPPVVHPTAHLDSCVARLEPSCRSVLAVVAGSTRLPGVLDTLIQRWRNRPNSVVLPVLPYGADPSAVFPPPADHSGAVFFPPGWSKLVAPDVLRAAGLGGDDYRLFLSYRRAEARDLADQLFDVFSHAGFQVFLDRFRGTPGRPFPRELGEELVDKGLVLVLESPKLRRSRWTLAEVAMARVFRLGLLAVAMPGAPPLASIPRSARFRPKPGEWNGPLLTPDACRRLVSFVRQRYLLQVTYRRMYLETLLRRALAGQSLTATLGPDSVYRVKAGGQDYAVHLASRPPQLGDARRVRQAGAGSVAPVLVGPYGLLRPRSEADLRWLAGRMRITLRREGELRQVAAAMAGGKVPP